MVTGPSSVRDRSKLTVSLASNWSHRGQQGKLHLAMPSLTEKTGWNFAVRCTSVLVQTLMYPKPSKFFQPLRASFDVKNKVQDAAVTKAISLMASAIHIPILFHMARAVALYWENQGGQFMVDELNEHTLGAKELMNAHESGIVTTRDFLREVEDLHWNETEDGEAMEAVAYSFFKETGISEVDQEAFVVCLSGCHDLAQVRCLIDAYV